MNTLVKLSLIVAAILFLGVFAFAGIRPARAGGACRGNPSTEGSGDAVRMSDSCFQPTVLHIEPGTTVAFQNESTQPHTVSGATVEWGNYNELRNGDSTEVLFATPGTYPYYCFIHPGMIGAVVVGDGKGNGVPLSPVAKVSQVSPVSEKGGPNDGAAGSAARLEVSPNAALHQPGDMRKTLLIGGLGAIFGATALGAGMAVARRNKA